MKIAIRALLGVASLAVALPACAQTVTPEAGQPESGQTFWAGAWGYATSPATRSVRGELPAGTYRYRMRLSQSGAALRLVLTNPDGATTMQIAAMSVARPAGSSGFAIEEASRVPVRFGRAREKTLLGGQIVESDPLSMTMAAGEDVVVEIVTAAPTTTVGGNAGFPVAFAPGAVNARGEGLEEQRLRPVVTQIAVQSSVAACTIVAMGDSITEGARGTRVGWRGWPGVLARRLVDDAVGSSHCGVVNMGISGNRLLRDGRGTAGVDRFERDIASVPGITHLIVLEGVNDIWRAANSGEPVVDAEDLIAGYRRVIAASRARGIRVIGGTITPGFGWRAFTREMEDVRTRTNEWIRTSGEFDAVIDFEAALRDSSVPPQIRRAFDSGDRLHPGNAGYEAMGRSIPLSLFAPTDRP